MENIPILMTVPGLTSALVGVIQKKNVMDVVTEAKTDPMAEDTAPLPLLSNETPPHALLNPWRLGQTFVTGIVMLATLSVYVPKVHWYCGKLN